jgi:hypothetical protein
MAETINHESRLEHAWAPNIRNGQPAMTCTNGGCRIVWWPDRMRPKSACRGMSPTEVARALIIGGAV